MKTDFLSARRIVALGFKRLGRDVRISRHALFFGCDRIAIGDHCRVDAFCLISAGTGITIGRNVHLSAYVSIVGRHEVTIGDFATISMRCSIFSSNDDYSGATMTNPTIPDQFRGAIHAPVIIGAHAILGTGVIVLPGVHINESASVGAGSLVKSDVPAMMIVAGVSAKIIRKRLPDHRALAEQLPHKHTVKRPRR